MAQLRTCLKSAVSYGLGVSGVGRLMGRLAGTSGMPAVLAYHRVVEHFDESARSSIPSMLISTRMLEQHLEWIGYRYRFVPLGELGSQFEQGGKSGKPIATVTFDDGYGDVFHNAFPLLQKMGIPATVFVVTDLVGKPEMLIHDELYLLLKRALTKGGRTSSQIASLFEGAGIAIPGSARIRRMAADPLRLMTALFDDVSQAQTQRMIAVLGDRFGRAFLPDAGFSTLDWPMLRQMQAAGITIGSHSKTHALLTNESRERVLEEATCSRRDLERHLVSPVEHFAYPDGRHNRSAAAAVAAAGYRFAFGTCRKRDASNPLMTIPRKVLWEKTSVDGAGAFSSAMMACQMKWLFDLGSRCGHNHGATAAWAGQ